MNQTKSGLDFQNARTQEQLDLMKKIEEDGVCPFCREHFTKYHPKPILKETDFWFVTENISPYEGTTTHIIFVYKPKHITQPKDMEKEAIIDLFACVTWVNETFSIQGGSIFMRFGNTHYNASSVEHLHAHLICGTEKGNDTEKIKVSLAHKKK